MREGLSRVVRAFAEQAGGHGELFWLEWQAERRRILKQLLLSMVCLVFAALAIAFAGVVILAISWDTPYRVHCAAGLALSFGAGFGLLLSQVNKLGNDTEGAFSATRQQLSEEIAYLRTLI